ncbi:energy transducer TonB [Pontibacter sp. G13]|uniref:energy transducer TonB n=1 Tax=Pontibacter sp. G13 TaxID=3074898 RepID=UPI00288ADA47|nr:energy transducer TonB [Pontibacter sp. G13]WNJ16703.1 energy transducer TonB [Pontibacter sp. G13]
MAQVIKADLDEMVFEDRERRYGAYFLRKKYPRHLLIGTIIISFIAVVATFGPLIAKNLMGEEEVEKQKVVAVTIKMEDLPPPPPMDEEAPPPPPPPKAPPPQVKTVAFQIPEPTPEEELDPEEDQTIATVEELEEAPAIGFEDKEGADEGFFDGEIDAEGDIPEVIVEQEPAMDAFVFAEEEPTPVNMDEIKQLVGYPQIARDAGIQGSVVVRVLVDKKGKYKRHKIINQVHPILAKAVEKHIDKLSFTPAIQGGKPIQFWVNIPFNFKLLN